MKYVMNARREMGIRTIFNILGPLTNPAGADYQVVGVYDKNLVEKIAIVLKNIGIKRGFVVSSNDGLDEVSISDDTYVAEITEHGVTTRYFSPDEVGYSRSTLESVRGGSAIENAEIVRSVLRGERGAKRDIVCLNAGFAIAAHRGISIKEGVTLAEQSIGSGDAFKLLERLIAFTNEV